MIQVRPAERSEIEWINHCYDEIEFVHSSFEKEIIAIAESHGQKAGLGRLVSVDPNHLELGGMYVFEAFRSQGVARKIVEFLLKYPLPHQTIYCIPFEHLVPFYGQFGFIECTNLAEVPHEISSKYLWCKEKYPTDTKLLIFSKRAT